MYHNNNNNNKHEVVVIYLSISTIAVKYEIQKVFINDNNECLAQAPLEKENRMG
jgi:hypothetical protein